MGDTYRDRSQVEVREMLSNAYKLRRRSKKKIEATVSCLDEVRKKKLIHLKKKYDVSNLKSNHWVSIAPEIKSFSIVA